MDKLCSALGLFFTDHETQELLSMFVDNMKSDSVVIRRTATECAISICEGSCSPYHYLSLLVNSLFVLTEEANAANSTGMFCLRACLCCIPCLCWFHAIELYGCLQTPCASFLWLAVMQIGCHTLCENRFLCVACEPQHVYLVLIV